MLKKLIKHEFKDTMRLFIPMFGFIVVLTPIFSLMMSLGSQPYNENTADALSTTIYLWLIPLTASKELPILLLKLLECR